MRRPRNNLSRLPFAVRETACRLVFEGTLTYAKIAAEIARLSPGVRIHASTLAAYQKGREYQDYVGSRRQWDAKLAKRQWAAATLNQGKGPQSVADLAALGILEQLHGLAEGGLLETGKDVARVATAIATMQRTQLAQAESARNDEIAKLRNEHEAELRALEEEIARKDAEIAKLKDGLEQAGKNRQISPEALAVIKQQIYGIKPTA